MGPDQLITQHGQHALRQNELAEAVNAFIIGSRNPGELGGVNGARLGISLVARVDEEISYANRAPDIASERHARAAAQVSSMRAKQAFTEALRKDKYSDSSALAYFGAAECLVSESINLAESSAAFSVDQSAAIEKLKREATRKYAAAFVRDPTVSAHYDALLPEHLDSEGARTLPAFHTRFLQANSRAVETILAPPTAVPRHEEFVPGKSDSWNPRVNVRPPAAAAVGKYDEDGARAEAELDHFRKQHNRRLAAAYSPAEIRDARNYIAQGLKQSRAKSKR
jgi:hypothetical protein